MAITGERRLVLQTYLALQIPCSTAAFRIMHWFVLARFPLTRNLLAVHKYLLANRVVHRFTEEGSQQVLWLAKEVDADPVRGFLKSLDQGKISEEDITLAETPKVAQQTLKLLSTPFTLSFVIAGFVGTALVIVLPEFALFYPLMFLPPEKIIASGQVWRVLTPVFLHFSWMHILFNSLWTWELGRRLETHLKPLKYLVLFVFTAIGGNVIQYYWAGSVNFGGLSGVVYGYFGFFLAANWARKKQTIDPILQLPKGIYVFFGISLVLGLVGILDKLIAGKIANGAHLGGLIFGILVALCYFGKGNIFNRAE